jgi:hypothetical protein
MSTTLYAAYDPFRGIPEPHLYFGLDLGRRRDLVTNLRVLFETKAPRIPPNLHEHDTVIAELAELQDTPTRRHDDLALALALAAWTATHP